MALPRLTGEGVLPAAPDPYSATLDEVYDLFVASAPFRAERELVFRALTLHVERAVLVLGAGLAVWIDGGFLTHKLWAPPKDVDLAYLVDPSRASAARDDECLSLWTLQEVSVGRPKVTSDRIQPMGGLVDAFFVPDLPLNRIYWDDYWSSVKDDTGNIIPGARKGYVEVRL